VRAAAASGSAAWLAALRSETARYQRAMIAARTGRQGDIHELRIATRRMLALTEFAAALAPSGKWRALVRELRRPFAKCARLRDLQATRMHLRLMRGDNRILQAMLEEMNDAVRRHRRRTAQRLETVRPGKTCRKIMRLAQRRSVAPRTGSAVNTCLDRSQRAVRAACRRMQTGGLEALHGARIAIKVYRYQLELAGTLGAGARPAELRTMRRLQKEFGAITDLELLRQEVKRYARRHPRRGRALAVTRRSLERERKQRFARALAAASRDDIVAT
jgi:CHAD domain-containing protein